jgi:hypothetical protein
MGRSILTNRLVELALQLRLDRPTHDEDGNLLGHWQDARLIEQMQVLAETLAKQEREVWGSCKTLERDDGSELHR